MANRSYIYALKDSKHYSLGESPYPIPAAFKILAAYDNAVVDSHLYDKIVGIKANFKKAGKKLYYFLDFLIATNQMKDHAAFVELVQKTREFLDEIDGEETLLENGEIYALYTNKEGNYLDGPGLEKTNQYACEDYKWMGEDIDHLNATGVKPEQLFHIEDETMKKIFGWMIELKDEWKETLGLDAWRKILYYQFTEK